MARKKVKEVEEFSDLNSGTERDKYLKKSRKVRAAKLFDSEENSDEQSDATSLILDLPKASEKRTAVTCVKINRNAKVRRTGNTFYYLLISNFIIKSSLLFIQLLQLYFI